MIQIFVTGTNTDAGKTHVSRALLTAARHRGWKSIGYKPVESGISPATEEESDAAHLGRAAGHSPLCTYRFAPPISPSVAARQAQIPIDVDRIRQEHRNQARECEFHLTEGAGGLLVPISESQTIADLAAALEQPLLIVAADVLGAINHTLLTLEVARQRNLPIVGVVLNRINPEDPTSLSNLHEIKNFTEYPVATMNYAATEEDLRREGEQLLDQLFPDS